MTEPPAYPAMPRYGENAPSPNQASPSPNQPGPQHPGHHQSTLAPAGPPQPQGSDHDAPQRGSGSWLSVAMAVVFNLVTLVGVLAFGWPAGNVFLLFWAENAVLGVITLVRVATAQAPSTGSGIRINGRPTSSSPRVYALFFTFHYGLFCVVHLVFTVLVAHKIGIEPTFFYLGVPLILIAVRYTVELLTTWFGPGGQRRTMSPSKAMMQPYPRIIVLHLAVLIGFGLVLSSMVGAGWVEQARQIFAPLLAVLPVGWQTRGVLLVVVLLLIKTVVDVFTTRLAIRRS